MKSYKNYRNTDFIFLIYNFKIEKTVSKYHNVFRITCATANIC